MLVFADYDNIDELSKARGIAHIVERVVLSVSGLGIAAQPRIDVRLYGGWFDGTRLSKTAQSIAVEIRAVNSMTLTIPWAGQAAPVTVIANAHIAQSLVAADQVPLQHTFRRRPYKGRLSFQNSQRHQCKGSFCPLDIVDRFLTNQRCTEAGCTVKQESVLYRWEQKLVDTMLIADLIYWASRPQHPMLAVLSSDDDMWPGIRTAIAFGQPIIQLHTLQSPLHPSYVGRLGNQSYLQTTF